jgi:hypothetical protein
MLTIAELTDAQGKLRQAHMLIEAVKGVFLSGAYIEGARMMNEVAHLLDDEVAAISKMIEGLSEAD